MKSTLFAFLLAGAAGVASAQVPVQANPDHEQMLASASPALAANKRLVYDLQREVLEGGHLELAAKYLAEDYIQHNPNVPTGRAGFVEFFSKFAKPGEIAPRVKTPIVSIVAEGDMVVISYRSQTGDTTWFDMFRVKNGKVAEHWDPMTKQ